MPSETKNLLLQKFLIPFRKRQDRDYNKIKGRSFSMSFDTVGRVGCAEHMQVVNPKRAGKRGKLAHTRWSQSAFCPALRRAACPELAAGDLPCW